MPSYPSGMTVSNRALINAVRRASPAAHPMTVVPARQFRYTGTR